MLTFLDFYPSLDNRHDTLTRWEQLVKSLDVIELDANGADVSIKEGDVGVGQVSGLRNVLEETILISDDEDQPPLPEASAIVEHFGLVLHKQVIYAFSHR